MVTVNGVQIMIDKRIAHARNLINCTEIKRVERQQQDIVKELVRVQEAINIMLRSDKELIKRLDENFK